MERIVVLLQWLILLLFVVIYTLLGLKRGTKKALYNLITSLFTTFIVLLFISFLSIKVILPPDKLLELIQKANLGDVENYILDESGNLNSNLYGVIYPILNVIFRMVLYIIIYPLFKLLLSLFVYRILWNKVFNKQKENSKTNEKVEDINTNANEVENEKIDVVKKQNKKTKEEDKNPCLRDRLIGATIGVFRGILVTFVFLLPLLGISASFSKFELATTEGENLSTTSTSNSNSNSETIEEVIKSVKAFSNSGVGAIFNARAEGKRSFSQVLFDFGFSQNIKTDESYVDDKHTKTNFDFSKELNLYVDIFKVAYQNGYLEDFDIDNLGENPNDSKAIEEILNNLSESDLTEIIARVGTDIVINKVLPEKLEGFDPNSNTTKEIVAELKKLDWNKEFLSLSDVTKEVLLFGSVKDIKEIANNPEKLMEMSEADRKKIGTIVEEIGDLQLLIATNIGVEYMIRQDSLLNKVTWLDTKEDKIMYLETRLNFLLSNKTLVKDDITSLSTFISDLLDDDFKQLLQPILNNEKFNVDNLPTSEAVNKILTDLTDIDLLMNIFPLGIDFYVYNNMPEIVPETADKISKLFENPDTMKGEVNNIKDIYANLLEIGLQPFFEDDVKLVEVIDRILEDDTKFDSVKIIVNKLFTDSKVISDLAKLVAEPMIESKVEDEELKQVLLKALNEDFEYGKEVNNLMDILETVYSFTNLTELKSISDGDKVENILNIVKELDSDILNDLEVDIKDLQIVNNAGLDFVKYIQSKKNIEQLVISEDATNETFKNDLSKIFDIIDETVQLIKENDITKVNYKTLNLVNLLNESDLKTVLTFTESDTNSIITTSLKSILEEKITSNDNLTLPILTDSEWIDEINYIIQGAFDLINLYATSPDVDYVFSYNNLINIKSIEDIPTSLILALSSNEELNPVAKKLVSTNSRDKAFKNLFSSKIVNTNVNNILNDKINEAVSKQNLTISLPNEIYNDNDMIKYNVITELLDAILPIFEKFVTTSTDNLKQTLDSINETTALEVYNDLSEIEIAKLSSGVLINNLFMDIFDNDSVQSLIVDKINETNIPENLKGTYEGLFDYDDTLTEDTLKDILLAVQSLELTEDTLKFKESYIKELLIDNKLDPLLNVDFVNKVLHNVIFLDEIKKYGETKFDEIATKVQGLEVDYEYYYAILNTLETNGKLDLDELHNLFNLATLIEDINIKDYLKDNKAADLINLILDNEDKKETLSNNNLLREAISKVLNDNNIKEFAVDKLNNIKISNSNLFNLKTTDLKFSEELFDSSNLIKSEELMSVFSLISSLDLNDLKGLSNFNKFKQVFNEDVITKLFNTNLVYLTINDLLQNESIKTNLSEFLNTKLESLKVTLTPSDLYLPKTALVEGKIDKEDLIQLVNSIYSLNITSFSDLKSVKSISDIKELLTDEVLEGIFEVKLIHHSLGNIFNKVLDLVADKMNKIFEDNNIELSFEDFIPSEIKDSNGYVKEEEFISLIHEVLNVNIDDFKNINIKSFEDIKTILPLETANSIINETFLYEVFNKIINNENIRIILSEKINSKLEKLNIEISQEDIKIPSLALDDDKLYKSDIEKLISTVYSLNIQEFSSLKNIVSTSDIKELLSENTLDNLFSIKFIHYSLSNIFDNPKVLEELASKINSKFKTSLKANDFKLPSTLKDDEGYVKYTEFAEFVEVLLNTDLEFSNLKNLNTITTIRETIPEELVGNILTDTFVYEILNKVINNPVISETLASKLTEQFTKLKVSISFTADDFKLPDTAKDEEGKILTSDLDELVHVLYTLNINNLDQISNIKAVSDIKDIVTEESLKGLFNIKFLHNSLAQLLNNQNLLEQVASIINKYGKKLSLTLDKQDLYLPQELKDENGYLKAEEFVNLINELLNINLEFSNIKNLKTIDVIKEAIPEEVISGLLTDTLFYDLINIVIQKDSFKEVVSKQINNLLSKVKLDYTVEPENIKLPSTALNENGYLLNTDLEKLVHTLYTLNITDFNQLTNIKSTADVRKIISDETLNSLFEIKLIHHSIGRMLNNEELLTNLADLINKNIKAVNIIITANDLAIPTSFKDENGYLEKEEIVNLLDVILDANLKFSEINDLKTISKLKVVFPEELTKELLTETMIYNLLNNLINSGSLKETIIEKVNPKLEKYNLTITKDNLQIPNTALTEDNKLLKSDLNTLVEVLYSLNIENISSLKTLPQIKETFTKPVLEKLFSIKFFHNSLAKLLNSDNLIEELTNYINKQIKSFNIELTKESLTIPSKLKDENGYIDSQSLVELVLALYNINIVNFSELNNLNTVTKIKEVFNQEFTTNLLTNTIVYDLIDNALNSNYFKDLVADKINNLLQKMKITSNIKSENINLPSVSLENGKIKKSELETFVSALYTIDYTDIDAIKKLKSVKDLNNILLTDTFEELLNTETIYYYLGYKLLQDKTLKSLAKTINSQLSKKGYYVSLTKDDFDFDNYDLYETSGTYYGYITKENLISVFEAINELDFSNLETNSTNNLINSLLEIFLEEKDNKYAVSSLLNTNLFTALYNNLLSKEFSKVYTTILNKKLSVNIDENVFDYSDSVYSGSIYSKTIKQEEIINLLKAVKELDITNNFNANSITRLLDNEDSFNNVFDSLILRSILTKALENNSLKVKLSNTINKNIDLGLIPSDFDIPTECYDEDNLLSKEEIKNILTSYKLLNLNDTKSISLNTFTDLIDSNIDTNNIDDFDRAFESKYIYSLIDKVFKKEFISNKVNESLNKVITNLNEIDLSLDDRLLENDILKYHEFKKIFVSVKLLNITDLDSINLELFMSLNNENGDLTKFLDSILIKKLVSQILTNDAIKETLASDVFNKEDLTLTPALDEYNELSVNEIKSLFDGLDLLGIDDFNNVNISVETLKELTEENVNKLLESTYLYQVIDLTLKAKIDDVPESSKEQDGNYKGFIKKSEINNLIETLKILDITDLNNVNLSIYN